MYSIFIFLLSTLAVWRIGHMILDENGPFNVFGKLANYTDKLKYKDGGLKQLLNCFYCMSVYLSIPFSIYLANNVLEFFIYVLAMSALSIFLFEWFDEK